MRDHRHDMTAEERAAGERFKQDITGSMRDFGARFEATPARARRRRRSDAAKRRDRRRIQRASRKANRR